ncbi:hypothetical protein [Rhizorhabdus dicambivorans]|uniref:Nucleotidyltransferase family protein n=1 Tax=Rhizorhabdus dicambivorans TaxID=1850238 RepID=A0A2A4G1M7_9SPHN|nr:hypothetical protein [Rhizorhabdus dicambivorans]ATE63468.1 hypothetical protein CMV14_02825 [Rhizorhabdus dicambivorans]PCE43687.1 hypothetical protein COO09_05145 [Rhizorhabdus dicambivorans]
MAVYRPAFEDALRTFAAISQAMADRGLSRPVLVGGAAVEFYTLGAINTGDFDLCSAIQPALEEELQRHGFIRPTGAGKATRGWIHPDLGVGFEVVGSSPLDGQADRERFLLVDGFAPGTTFTVISVEDLIADRMGQYASGSAPEMLGQARALLRLHPDVDMAYLEKRVRFESAGDYGADDVEG